LQKGFTYEGGVVAQPEVEIILEAARPAVGLRKEVRYWCDDKDKDVCTFNTMYESPSKN
jgi:hypothetical protein